MLSSFAFNFCVRRYDKVVGDLMDAAKESLIEGLECELGRLRQGSADSFVLPIPRLNGGKRQIEVNVNVYSP